MMGPEQDVKILNRRYDAVQALSNVVNTELVEHLRRNLGQTKNIRVY
jgi:hypothetical protein